MSLLALLVFYLPPDSGEKVSLGITVLLSFSVFLLLVAENVPKTSEFVPLLGKNTVFRELLVFWYILIFYFYFHISNSFWTDLSI